MEIIETNKIKQQFEKIITEYLEKNRICKYIHNYEDLKSWNNQNIIKFEFKTTKKLYNFGKVESDFINQFLEIFADQLHSAISATFPIKITNKEELIKIKKDGNSSIIFDKLLINSEQFYELELKEINYINDKPLLFNLWGIDLIKIYPSNKIIKSSILYDSGMITLNFYGKDNIELETIENGDLITINLYFIIDISETYCFPESIINSIKKIEINTNPK